MKQLDETLIVDVIPWKPDTPSPKELNWYESPPPYIERLYSVIDEDDSLNAVYNVLFDCLTRRIR